MNRTPTWILIGNSSRARLYAATGERPWRLLLAIEHPESRAKTRDLVTDDRGCVRQSGRNAAKPAMDSRTSPKELEAIRFAARIAGVLRAGLDRHAYEEVAIVAPPRFLGLLRRELPKHV